MARVDRSVGRILDTLRELEIAENTLVVFTSDNGPAHGLSAGRLRGVKGGDKYEGHMRVPTITWWPGKVAKGAVTEQIAATTDLLPTFAGLAGADVPQDRIIDGKDVLKILLGDPRAKSPHTLHYYENDGIRRGKWKLIRKANGKTELFDLAADPAETHDLSSDRPDLISELVELLDAHAAEIAANTRPAGFVESGTAKPILDQHAELPRLREYLGIEVGDVVGEPLKAKRKKKH
jgi:arylsulfatase A-like enzyme